MKKIDAFVHAIYHDAKGNQQEIQELKTEMKTHLLECVHELMTEGKSEKEAINIALSRFGEEKELRSVIGQVFQTQRFFAKWVLFVAIAFLVVCFSAYAYLWQKEEAKADTLSQVATDIARILEGKTSLTPAMKAAIDGKVNNTDFISNVKIFNVEEVKKSDDYIGYGHIFAYVAQAKPDYFYEQPLSTPSFLQADFFPYGNGDEHWYVEMEERDFGSINLILPFVGISVYWALFAIWATINSYHHKRLHVGWFLTFVIFNVLGYLLYHTVGLLQKRRDINA